MEKPDSSTDNEHQSKWHKYIDGAVGVSKYFSNPNGALCMNQNYEKHKKSRSNSYFHKLEAAQALLELNTEECADSVTNTFIENNCLEYEESQNDFNSCKQSNNKNYKLSVEKKSLDCRGSVSFETEDDIDKYCSFFKKKKQGCQILYDLKKTGTAKNFAPQTCGPRFKRKAEKEKIDSDSEKELFENVAKFKRKAEKLPIGRKIENNDTDSDSEKELIENDFFTIAREKSREQQIKESVVTNFTRQTSGSRFKRKFEEDELESEPERKLIDNDFKSAKEELKEQNIKRYGAGRQKRNLGIRRGAQSKFVSPVLSSSDIEPSTSKDDEHSADYEVDERLKHIEPKMVELIRSEIMDSGAIVAWDDIAGLEFAKSSIQEAVVWPMLRPDIFTGLRRPPKAILLFGPPGTGKTLIGKCVASQSKSTFFSISASSLTSKWIGDGEKMVRALFCVARCHQPAVIFIDEIDSLLSQRSDTEHESSRRIKTEFLVQLDGATTDSEERLLVIGATNRPQELDEAARRRFVKRLYIPLPQFEARQQLVKQLMKNEKHSLSEEQFCAIAELSDGYSGADLKNLCCEAALGPIRVIDFRLIEKINADDVRPVNMEDFEQAFLRVKSSVGEKDLDQYITWNRTYGSDNRF